MQEQEKTVVAHGALVLDTGRQAHGDLLILDIMRPGLGGLEVHVSVNVPQLGRERSLCPA